MASASARYAHARRTRSGGSASCTSPAWTKSAAAVWPGRSWRRPSCCIPTATSPASPIRRSSPRCGARAAFEQITRRAVAWAVAAADPAEIDRINIHQASLRAMQRAVLALVPLPDIVLVDAFRVPDLPMAQRGVVARRPPLRGDRRRVDRRQGDARSADARAARARSALRLRSSQGLRDAPIIWTPSRASATRLCIAARSGRRRCLIRSTRSRLADLARQSVAIDRDDTLRNAEKLLRQGKLDAGDRRVPPRRRGPAARLEHRQHARRPLRARRPDRQGRRAIRAHRRRPEPRRLLSQGRCALQEDPQNQARRRDSLLQPGELAANRACWSTPSPTSLSSATAGGPAGTRLEPTR